MFAFVSVLLLFSFVFQKQFVLISFFIAIQNFVRPITVLIFFHINHYLKNTGKANFKFYQTVHYFYF